MGKHFVTGKRDALKTLSLGTAGLFSGGFHDTTSEMARGVHKHWNNAIGKQYSRNLGKGNGI
jgi:hypothetical protein